MSYSKISSILLYVVASISLVVMLFFYAAPKTLDIDELEDRVLALTTDDVMPVADEQAPADTTASDSLAMEEGESDMMAEAETDSTEVDSVAVTATEAEMTTAGATEEIVDLRDHLTGWELMVYKRTDYALGWAYILFIIAAIAALVFPVISIATNMKAIIRLVAVLGAAAILIILSYFVLASDVTIDILGYTGTENSNPVVLKWVGTGLFSTYFLFGLAVLSILYSEVVKLFK